MRTGTTSARRVTTHGWAAALVVLAMACGGSACGGSGGEPAEPSTTPEPAEPAEGPSEPAEDPAAGGEGGMSPLEAEQDASEKIELSWGECEVDEDCAVISLSSECEPCGGPNLAVASAHEEEAKSALPLEQYAADVECEEPESSDCTVSAQCLAGSCNVVVGDGE